MMRFLKARRSLSLAAALVALLPVVACASFFQPDVRPSHGVTGLGWLSDYHAPLKGTNLDTPVYFMDSGKPGATMLLIGGTHPREIAGHTAALITLENARVTEGRLIVIPALNASGYSNNDESTNLPRFHEIQSRSGRRLLPLGDRRVTRADQKTPDPAQYKHQSGAIIPGSKGGDGEEMRNINRAYPGLPDGTPTQQAAFAVMELIRREGVVLDMDMHEAGTPSWYLDRRDGKVKQGGRLAYMLVCNPKDESMEMGAEVIMDMTADYGLRFTIEPSNPAFRGLSHLEIGNATDCLSFLFETPNPGQDPVWREAPDIINDVTYPLKHRAGLHLEVYQRLVRVYNENHDKKLVIENLPGYDDLMGGDVGAWLN